MRHFEENSAAGLEFAHLEKQAGFAQGLFGAGFEPESAVEGLQGLGEEVFAGEEGGEQG